MISTIAHFMKTVDDGILTEIGFKLLQNDLASDLEILKESIEQQALCRVCCHMCVSYCLLLLFGGYLQSHDVPDEIKTIEWKPIALMLEEQLPLYQAHLTDEYAQIFHDVKLKSFIKPIFGHDHIPAHPDDLPQDFDKKKYYNERGF